MSDLKDKFKKIDVFFHHLYLLSVETLNKNKIKINKLSGKKFWEKKSKLYRKPSFKETGGTGKNQKLVGVVSIYTVDTPQIRRILNSQITLSPKKQNTPIKGHLLLVFF